MSRYAAIALATVVVAGVQYGFGRYYCYRYFKTYFKMPQWLAVGLSLGGIATAYFVMIDQFTHTSLMGENTRTWKNDPEHGIHIIPVKKLDSIEPVAEPAYEPVDWNKIDAPALYVLMSMVYNLAIRQNRLSRRLIKLEKALRSTNPETRKYVAREGRDALRGKINVDLVHWQSRQHPLIAIRGEVALLRIFGADLGPLDPKPVEDDFVGF